MKYTVRAQTLLTAEQMGTLTRLANERGTSVSGLIREAVEASYIATERDRLRSDALARLFDMDVPAEGWEAMELAIELEAAGAECHEVGDRTTASESPTAPRGASGQASG